LVLNGPREFYAPQQIHATIAQLLDRARFRVFVALPRDSDDPEAWRGNSDATLWFVPFGRSRVKSRGIVGKIGALLGLAEWVLGVILLAVRSRAARIKIIHTDCGPRDTLAGLVIARLTGAALVLHLHETRQNDDPLHLRLGGRWATRVIAVSEASRRSFVTPGSLPAAKVHVVHNGIDVGRFWPGVDGRRIREKLGIPATAKVVLLAGRLVPWKGQAELVQAVALLRTRGRDLTALVVGQPDVVAPGFPGLLNALIDQVGVRDRVVLTSFPRRDMPEVMAAADIVAVPSYDEPFGLVALEAMATGRPVVGSNTGGIPEIMYDEISGLLVPPGDPTALANGIERYLAEPALVARVIQNAREQVVTRFSRERMVEDVAREYETLLKGAVIRGVASGTPSP
jgi:glycosyltransferase involved in cell wall biosynthesis